MSFLTAATFIYTIGAGITAGAGTRLVLQLFLVKVFTLYSFQTQALLKEHLHWYFSSLPRSFEHWVICAPAAFLGSGSYF
jgi:hypothetical protein